MGGDFNITRLASERREKDRSYKDGEDFNDFISQLDLIDMPLADRLFTWSNMRLNSVMAKLDRVFVFENWDVKFSLAEIRSLQHPTSNRIPISLISGEMKQKTHKRFHFEKWWLEYGEVYDLIRESWVQRTGASDATADISIKLCRLRKVLAKWKWRFKDGRRSEKENILKEMEILEKLEESCNLSLNENSRVLQLRRKTEEIYKREELRWRQRSYAN